MLKAEWQDKARSLGATEEQIDGLTIEELKGLIASLEPQPEPEVVTEESPVGEVAEPAEQEQETATVAEEPAVDEVASEEPAATVEEVDAPATEEEPVANEPVVDDPAPEPEPEVTPEPVAAVEEVVEETAPEPDAPDEPSVNVYTPENAEVPEEGLQDLGVQATEPEGEDSQEAQAPATEEQGSSETPVLSEEELMNDLDEMVDVISPVALYGAFDVFTNSRGETREEKMNRFVAAIKEKQRMAVISLRRATVLPTNTQAKVLCDALAEQPDESIKEMIRAGSPTDFE